MKKNSTTARIRSDGTVVRIGSDGREEPLSVKVPPSKTQDEIEAAAAQDAENPPITPERAERLRPVPRVKTLRRALGLTQEEFAARYGIPIGTLRDWEQGRTEPDQAARAYLNLIARDPLTPAQPDSRRKAASPEFERVSRAPATASERGNGKASIFAWSDPRQVQIYDDLLFTGEGPAAFFRDACTLMDEPGQLQSATHLVGHLVREIESALRASLKTFAHRAEQAITKNRNSETHAVEIRAIASGLGLKEEDEAVQAWLRLADRSYEFASHAVAHRDALARARPVTDEFRSWWTEIQSVLLVILEKFKEQFLRPLHELDRLLALTKPSHADAAFLKNNIPNNAVFLGYFFDKNQNALWLKPLTQEGLFRYPPREGRWPQAGYLARMAGVSEAVAAQVAEVVSGLPGPDNPLVRAELLEGIAAMPPAIAARLTERIERWAQESRGFFANDFSVLIGRLAEGGQAESALGITRALLEVLPPSESDQDEPGLLAPIPLTRLDLWHYEEILTKQIPKLMAADGLRTLALLCDLLTTAIRFSLREPEKSVPNDVSGVWLPVVETRGEFTELRSLLACSVRDAAVNLVKSNRATVEQVIRFLEERDPPWWIYRRIGLQLLARFHGDAVAIRLAAERLTDRRYFDASDCLHEYVLLLHGVFRSLNADEQREILGWVDAGPLPEQLENVKRNIPQFTGKQVTQDDLLRFTKAWRRDWLQRLGDLLPPEKVGERDTLVAELGQRQHPDLPSYRTEVVGSQSPVSREEFAAKSIDEQIHYLRDWVPSADQFMGPSRTGLGEQLAKLVAENPQPYATAADLFGDVNPTYQRFLLNGLREAVEKARPFDWSPALRLCQRILAEPTEIPGRRGLPLEDDPDRTWCRNEIATLVETALRRKPVPIPMELRYEVWQLLEVLSEDPNPTPEHEARYGGSNMDPATLALNSTRGQGIHGVIYYAWWVRQSISKKHGADSEDKAPPGFDAVPEAREALEKHLDLKTEPSLAIRAVFGQRFLWLWLIDQEWAKENAERIFPVEDSRRAYWDAAWSSYLAFCQLYGDVFEGLRAQYELAVERLQTASALPRLPIDPGEPLAEHLVRLYWAGKFSVGGADDIWSRFWSNAPVAVRRHALWHLGRLLYDAKDTPDLELLTRLRNLWEQRLSVATQSGEPQHSAAEIAQFGWWFCSKRFPLAWGVQQLLSALEFAGYAAPDHLLYGALAEASATEPKMAALSLEKIAAKANLWELSAYEKDIRQILSAAKAAGGESANVTNRVVNMLARRGMLKFRDLVE